MSLKDDVKKNFGDNILLTANSIIEKNLLTIPVSPALDIVLNGGIPEGSFVIFTGQPKCGKTTTSLDFCATAQKPEYAYGSFKAGREVYYLNIEGRLKKRDLEGIPGLNLERFNIIGSQEGKILHAEEYLQIAERIINEIPGSVLIIDSYSALCTEAEITSDMNKMQRADGAKLLAKFCRKVANVIPVNRNIVIGITHLMGNPGMGHSEWKEKR
jgi:RecA/RadA recombinase